MLKLSQSSLAGWLALLAISLIFADRQLGFGPIIFYPPELLIYPTLAVLLYYQESRDQLITVLRQLPRSVKLAIGLILVGGIIGTVFSPLFPVSIGALKAWLVTPLVFFWLAITFIKQPSQLVGFALGYGILLSLVGFWQLADAGTGQRLTAGLESANYVAAILAPMVLIAFFSAWQSRRWWLLIVGLVILVATVLSQSLGGMLGIVIGLLVASWYLPKSVKVSLVLMTIILAFLAWPILAGRLSGETNSLRARKEIWVTSAYMLKLWPITGSGLRGFEHNYPNLIGTVFPAPQEWTVAQPHNLLLSIWLNIGLFGLLGFLLIITRALGWPAGLSAFSLALVVLLGHGLTDTPYWRLDMALMFWTYIAGAYLLRKKTNV